MKKTCGMALLGATAMIVCTESAMATPVLETSFRTDSTNAVEARIRELGWFNRAENSFALGLEDRTQSGTQWIEQADFRSLSNGASERFSASNPFVLSYDGNGVLSLSVQGTAELSISRDISDKLSGALNYLQISIANRVGNNGISSDVSVADLKFNGSQLGSGSLVSSGFADWHIADNALGAAWQLTGNMLLSGEFDSSNDLNRIGFTLGTVELTIIPLPGAAGMALAGMGMIGLRRRR
jgi:hypothetical protein